MARTYDDFVIDISPNETYGHTVRVVKSSAGECVAPYQFPFDRSALDVRLKDLQIALLRSGGARRKALLPEEQTVQDFGAVLYDSLFTGEVRSLYEASLRAAVDQGNGLRLRLRIQAPDMAALPWEYIYDGKRGDFVALAADIPIVRHLPVTGAAEPLAIRPPLRVLGIVANPSNLPPIDVRAEQATIERALGDLVRKGLVELTWVAGQGWRELRQAIRSEPWNVFHFTGHGGFDPAAKEGVVYFTGADGQSDALSATELNRLLAGSQGLRLVVLNACQGAASDERDIFSSSAAMLVRGGVPAVVAMQYAITDTAAAEFGRTFYEAIIDGLPVDAAVDEARRAISVSIPNSLEWGIPVLFMRATDGRIFDVDVKALRAAAPPPPAEQAPSVLEAFPAAPSTQMPDVTEASRLPEMPTQVKTENAATGEAAAKSPGETTVEVAAAVANPPESEPAPAARVAASQPAPVDSSGAAGKGGAPSAVQRGRRLWLWFLLGVGAVAVAGLFWGVRQGRPGASSMQSAAPAIAATATPEATAAAEPSPMAGADETAAPEPSPTAVADETAAPEPSPTAVADETAAPADFDSDGDNLSNGDENNVLGTDPNRPDTDGDGVDDGEEVARGMVPLSQDSDSDGLLDGEELNIIGSNPMSPDTDSDGIHDDVEVNELGTDPTESDSDGDALLDGREVKTYRTDPAKWDTDGDSITDGEEIFNYKTDPLKADTDDDGLNDAQELELDTTDPRNPDSDGDGILDGDEPAARSSPAEADTVGDETPESEKTPSPATTPGFGVKPNVADAASTRTGQAAFAPAFAQSLFSREQEQVLWNAVRWGEQLSALAMEDDDPQWCNDRCLEDEACKSWTLEADGTTSTCYLFGDETDPEAVEGYVTGLRGAWDPGWEWNTALVGAELWEVSLDSNSPFECQAKCFEDDVCEGWTWHKPPCLDTKGGIWCQHYRGVSDSPEDVCAVSEER